jgi:hypothetical protein
VGVVFGCKTVRRHPSVRTSFPLAATVTDWLEEHVHSTPLEVIAEDAQCRATLGAEPSTRAQRPGRRTNAHVRMTEPAVSTSQPPPELATERVDEAAEDEDSLYDAPESLYEPPGSVSSGGYVSPAATEGMGSLGDLVSSDGDGDLESPMEE